MKNLRSLFPLLTLVLTLGLCAGPNLLRRCLAIPILGTELGVSTSSAAARQQAEEGVPQAYCLMLGRAGHAVVPIQWEIPELGEVVKGYNDGKPMEIHRTHPRP